MSPQAHVENLVNISKAKAFLGSEFLTWLWHRAETTSDAIKLNTSDGQSHLCEIWVGEKVVLESTTDNATAHYQTLKGNDPSKSAEAAAALITGKTVKEMQLGINIADVGDFTATLNGNDLCPKSLKLPDLIGDLMTENRDSDLEARLQQSELYLDIIDSLFSSFLDERMADSWEDDNINEIRQWIKDRSDNKAKLH